MSHRILWPLVACLGLGGLILVISQSTAQRPGSGMPGMPGGMPGMPGRFVVANASSSQVLILDTATGQVYRALEKDIKKLSELPHMGGGGDARPPARDRRSPAKDKDDVRPPARDKRTAPKDQVKDKDEAPDRR